MRLLSYIGWLAAMTYICSGCGGDTPVSHKFCVLAHPTKMGDDRYVCTVTAKFESAEACHMWEEVARTKDPDPYKDGRLTTKCGKD